MELYPIDESMLREHSHLRTTDECYYMYDYFPRQPYDFSPGNSLICNLKKSVGKKDEPVYRHKISAISDAIMLMKRHTFPYLNYAHKSPFTIVPIPPSKTLHHPLHDDRMWQIAQNSVAGYEHNAVPLLTLTQDRSPSHENGQRPKPKALKQLLTLETGLFPELHPTLVLIDDVITNGTHFVACKDLILEALPEKTIIGVFLARTFRD